MRKFWSSLFVCLTSMLFLGSVVNAQSLPTEPTTRLSEKSTKPVLLVPRFAYVANHDSNDISAFEIEAVTGMMSPIAGSPFKVEPGPSALAVSPDARYLFVANTDSATIATYRIGQTGEPTPVSMTGTPVGGRPTKLAIDPTGRYLFSANRMDGSVSAFAIDGKTGELRALKDSPFRAGSSPSGITVSPDGRFVYVSDLAERAVAVYSIGSSADAIYEIPGSPFPTAVPANALTISSTGRQLYLANTGDNLVSVYTLDELRGSIASKPSSTLTGRMESGEVVASADQNSVYVGGSTRQSLSRIASNASTGRLAITPLNAQVSDGALLLATEPTGRFLYTASPTADRVTRYLINANTRAPDTSSGLDFATGSAPSAIVIAVTPKPQVTGTISVTLNSGSLLTYSGTTGDVHIQPAATNTGGTACAGQIVQLAFSVPSIGVISTSTQNPATSVCVPTGQTDASFNVTTSSNSGSATLTGFASGFTNGTVSLSVNLRQLTISLPFTSIAVGHVVSGTLTLANPAPTAGVTVALASNASQTATIAPASIHIAAGSTAAVFSVTGVAVNTATMSASVAAGGYSTSSIGVTILPAGKAINLPHNLTVAPGQSLPYPVTIGAAATSAVSISFATTGGPGTATITPNPVIIPVGATAPTTQPTIKGGAIGPLNETGSATGYGSDLENVTVSITLTLNPASQSVQTGKTATLTLSASSVAPTGGFVIHTAMDDVSKATVPATIIIPAGSATATVTITGVAAGTTTLRATAPGAVAASSAITVNAPPGITLNSYVYGGSTLQLGKNGLASLYGSLAVVAPAGNLNVTLTSSNPSILQLSATPNVSGSPSIVVQVPAGSASLPTFYAQASAATGTATITASATGYSNGIATATLVPSGFIVQGGSNTTTLSTPPTVTIAFVQLDPTTLNYSGTLTSRAGAPPVTVALNNSNTTVGKLATSSFTFRGGISTLTTTYTPLAAGSSTITFNGTPTGYSTAANYQSTAFTVTTPTAGFSSCYGGYYTSQSFTLGKNAQSCGFTPLLAAPAPTGGRTVTLTSSNAAKLLLSTNATVAGSASITVTVPGGSQYGPTFYVQSLSNTASATVTETAPGYSPATLTVNFALAGFIIQGTASTTTFSTPSPVYVTFAQLDGTSFDYTGSLSLRPGAPPVTVSLGNTNTAVGTLGVTSIVFNPGDTQHQTTFTPTGTAAGTSTITISGTSPIYSAPGNYKSAIFTVTAPNSGFSSCYGSAYTTFAFTLGKNGQSCAFDPLLAAPAPSGGRVVTLKSSDPTKLLLSASPTTAGSATLTLNVAAGSQYGPAFYVQSLSNTGTATVTETVPGFTTSTMTVTMELSAFIIQGTTSTTTFSTPSPVYVTFAQLDPMTFNYVGSLSLRAGAPPVTVSLANTNTAVGTLGAGSIVFNPGDSQKQTTFAPTGTAAGTSTITISGTSPVYSAPANYKSAIFTVTAPNSGFSSCYGSAYTTMSITLGKNALTCGFSPLLAAPAPTGGRTVTLTSGSPGQLLLSTTPTAVGSTSITLNVPAGSQYGPAFYVQALNNTGTVTITETVAGFNPATLTVGLVPSGFILQGGTATTTFATPSPTYVTFAQLDPTTLNYTGSLTLRPGVAPATVGLKDSNTAVGTLAAASLTFNAGDSQHQTTFTPLANGTATISFTGTPAGFSAASNYNNTVYTVTAPNTGFSSCYGGAYTSMAFALGKNAISCGFNPLLAAPAPTGGRTVTLTSNSANLLVSASPTAVGAHSINVNVAAGSQYGATFYVQTLTDTGSATITETVSGYNPSTLTVNFAKSGFILQSDTTTTTFSPASPVYVTFSQLDPSSLNYVGTLTLRPGVPTVTVGLSNSNATVGKLGSASIVFNGGSSQLSTTYTPTGSAAGVSVISFSSTPAGYTASTNYKTATFTVNAPAITVIPATIGKNLQTTTYGYLALPAPSGGRTVTVSSSDTTKLLLSTTGTTTGTGSLTFNLAAGQQYIPNFYVQSLAGNTTANVVMSASGYANGTGTMTLYPSGFALQASDFTTHLTDNPTTLTIVPAALDPTYLNVYQVQQLRPNQPGTKATLTLTDQSGTSPVGKITLNPVTFQGDDTPNAETTSFQPLHAGTTLIKVTSPAGFTNASTQVTATVVP